MSWCEAFYQKHNRKPRILHIGNIANNAYQNAKMLNAIGYDCDVLCNDYYHFAGCPEWDDADFIGEIQDQFYPNWSKVDLNGFIRPRWFAQGGYRFCKRYLLAKSKEKRFAMRFWWHAMETEREYIVRTEGGDKVKTIFAFIEKLVFSLFGIVRFIVLAVFKLVRHPIRQIKRYPWIIKRLICGQRDDDALRGKKDPVVLELEREFSRLFPDRPMCLGNGAMQWYYGAQDMKPLLEQYDIVVAYADRPIFPYLAGIKNYIAFEHGTIRDMPYEENDWANLMLLAYANARAVCVTNVDCVSSAEYITKNTPAQIVHGLHGIDIDRIQHRIRRAIASGNPGDYRFGAKPGEKVFFCPSRHDFDKERGAFLKGEEKMLDASARLAEEGRSFKLVLVNFGHDVEAIKSIIHSSQALEERVVWVEPMEKVRLFQAYYYCDGILDQFLLPAFGAITIEALCAGGGVLISQKVPNEQMEAFFGEQLPSFVCEDEDDIYDAMKTVMEDETSCRERAALGKEWIEEHHANARIVDRLEKAFAACCI